MKTDDFDYFLPEELIAQDPAPVRDKCRLLVVDKVDASLEDRIFRDIIDYVEPGDLFVVNETRVRPARLLGRKHGTGGESEVLLLRERMSAIRRNDEATWEALVRPGKRLKPGALIDFTDASGELAMQAEIEDWVEDGQRGERLVRLTTPLPSLDEALHAVGHTPLPPYIKDYTGDEEMYQTVYSRQESSAAAPTAGLHFTPELIEALRAKGCGWSTVELEVGLDTFRLVDEDDPSAHRIHTEQYYVPKETVDAVIAAHTAGKRVIAVGTTSVRSLESAAWPEGFWTPERVSAYYEKGDKTGAVSLRAVDGEATSLYILPGYEFQVVDALITNFHVPRSTLLMLVSAFSSRETMMTAYAHAIEECYRFFSFGDAMFIH